MNISPAPPASQTQLMLYMKKLKSVSTGQRHGKTGAASKTDDVHHNPAPYISNNIDHK